MLLNYGFRNFFSFREGAVVSLELDPQAQKALKSSRPFSTALCIKGANASGKTHALKAISFLAYFVSNSFKEDPEAKIPISTHFSNQDCTDFSAEFVAEKETYCYELSVKEEKVVSEKIFRKKNRKTPMYLREENSVVKCVTEWSNLEKIKLRKNASVVSMAKQYEFNETLPISNFFSAMGTNVTHHGLSLNDLNENQVAEFMRNNQEIHEFVQKFIAECDVGITKLSIESKREADGKETFLPSFHHGDGSDRAISSQAESSGTRSLFKQLIRYKAILDMGGVLIADEFDLHLHPHILPKILDLFIDPIKNPNNAQIIFTTHNSAIVDYMGKYRTCLVEKEDNESFLYRLDEIRGDILRNDRPISPLYRDGRLGGVPKI